MSGPAVRDLVRQAAHSFARREAVVSGNRRLSYGEAWDRGLRLANVLAASGLSAGDRVGVLEENTLAAADFLTATTAAGITRVPLHAGASPAVHRKMLAGTGCRAVVLDSSFEGLQDELAGVVGGNVLIRDERYESTLMAASSADPDPPIAEEDTYVIRHTGGTSGSPKAVACSQRSWLASCRDWFYGFPPPGPGSASLNVSPIAHGSGYFFTPIWLAGGVNVLLARFDAREAADLLERESIEYLFVVPSMLDQLARQLLERRRQPADLRVVAVAGAPVPAAVARRAQAAFGDVLYQVYGQTEAVPATLIRPEEWLRPDGSLLRSAGRAHPFSAICVLGPNGLPVGTGIVGQIAIRAAGQMEGYLADDNATRLTVVDGWIRSGDAGYLDEDGFLFVLDRIADRIEFDGQTLWPSQIEDVALEIVAVEEAAAVAGGDGLVVVVVGPASLAKDVADRVEAAVGVRPTVTTRTTALPKSPVGKLQRAHLQAETQLPLPP